MSSIMISCGEASGDLYAGALARELQALDPQVAVFGFGGEQLARSGAELVGDYRGISVTGLLEVVRLLPRTYMMYRRLVAAARARRPDVFVAIDFPDFNFRLGRAIHELGIPVVYYVSPQLWAWRPGRLKVMRRFVDLVLPIFPFEVDVYARAGMAVEFLGHPLVDLIRPVPSRGDLLRRLGCDPSAPVVALLPGSRPNEVKEILPTLVEAAHLVAARVPGVQFVLARAPRLDDTLFAPVRGTTGARFALVEDDTDAVLAAADVVVTASGTATIQTALHQRPMVVVYRLSALTYRLGKPFVKVNTYGMVNLVAGRRVAVELIQERFTPAAVADETVALLTDPGRAAAMRESLADVRHRLGAPGASRRAAARVLDVALRGRVRAGALGQPAR
jgi:lipid-A-disaccharide synthase